MPKRELRLLMLHEFKLGHNVFQTSTNINRAKGEESTCDRKVRMWFQEIRSGDESLEDEEVEDKHAVLITNNCKQFLSKFFAKV